ncbi:hypothetical protein N7465_001933 [Penicillium sp. CMV-2018d]|nr:hypothetical protein N7465_001933 [Penicillium sp. CMV-2018d]
MDFDDRDWQRASSVEQTSNPEINYSDTCPTSNKAAAPEPAAFQPTAGESSEEPKPIIESNSETKEPPGAAFRPWRYVSAVAGINTPNHNIPICIDTGCGITLTDKSLANSLKLQKHPNPPISVSGLGSKHSSTDYVKLPVFFEGTDNIAQLNDDHARSDPTKRSRASKASMASKATNPSEPPYDQNDLIKLYLDRLQPRCREDCVDHVWAQIISFYWPVSANYGVERVRAWV